MPRRTSQPRRLHPLEPGMPQPEDYISNSDDSSGDPDAGVEGAQLPAKDDVSHREKSRAEDAKKEPDVHRKPEGEGHRGDDNRFRRRDAADDGEPGMDGERKQADARGDSGGDEDGSLKRSLRERVSKKSGRKKDPYRVDDPSVDIPQTSNPNEGFVEDMEHMDEGDMDSVQKRRRRLHERLH